MLKAQEIDKSEAQKLKGYTFEEKIDGFRSFFINKTLLSDRGINENRKFPHIAQALLSHNVVLDGEIALKEYSTVHKINSKEFWNKAVYFVFDILAFNGEDLTFLPLIKRREYLCRFFDENKLINLQLPTCFTNFNEGWNYVQEHNLEGLIAKDLSSRYHSLDRYDLIKNVFRVKSWYKIKNFKEDRLEIIGYEAGKWHGTFILEGNHRISALSPKIVDAYNRLKEYGKVYAEFCYLYKTENQNYFQPILKNING